ncbi:MAG: YitT family protein [Bacilli bacterium]|nr:YitT family protein [Bacilli bacterium]
MSGIFKWRKIDFLKALLGTFLFAFALNIFIVPKDLYNGGILGVAELMRSVILQVFNLHTTFDFSGIINFIINIPLLIYAYNKVSKTFFARTMYCVLLQTIFLSIIPTTINLALDETITNVVLGGIIAGIGSGFILSTQASGGGTDIIGIALASKNRKLSVGKVGFICNMLVFVTCGILRSVDTMVYSIIYAGVLMFVLERTHDQNVCTSAMIFTKDKPTQITDYIRNELNRDATIWEGIGLYQEDKTYVCYAVLSRYELLRLERNLKEIDEEAFLIKDEDIKVNGNFEKKLIVK